ncbi:MAG TPA: ABC transporter permease [Chthoniobacterales bacterium]|jgi:predicted permease|nr:ABC transporter permease [Chthoniobacterales bacterium]
MKELRYAFRQLLRQPGFTIIAVVALALGIGANTVLFSAINTLFFRPLSYPEPQQLVRVWGSFPERGLDRANVSWPRYQAWRDQQQSFIEFSAQSFTGFTLTGRGDPENLNAVRVTENFFRALGVQPLFGRVFTPEEDKPGGANVAVLTHTFWQKRFGGDQNILGQSITLNGVPFTVIGVMPPSLKFPFIQTHVFAPRVFEQEGLPPDIIERGTGYLTILARMKPGVKREHAEEQMRVVDRRYQTAQPDKVDAKAGMSVVSLHEDLVGRQRPMLLTLFAAVGCVLLVGCANVANLLLARFIGRRKEIAIRTALGATRARIVFQFLAESVLTAGIAGVLGVLLSIWGLDILKKAVEDFLPRSREIALDVNVLLFAIGLSLITGIVLGLVPALHASRSDPIDSLKDSSRGSTGRQAGRLRAGLLVAEVALSLVLVVGAVLLVDSFRRLQNVDPGFRAQGVTTFFVGLPPASYPNEERQGLFFQNALEKIKTLPGITHAAAASNLPAADNGNTRSPAAVEGQPLPPVSDRTLAVRSTISPGFFDTLGIPLKQGRDFTWQDRPNSPLVVIINETMAKKLFPGENPIGRRLITGIASIPREVVGVAGDVRAENLSLPPGMEMYYPAAQIDGAFLSVVVRSSRPATSLRTELISAVHSLDPGLPIDQVQSYTEVLSNASAERRLSMYLLGGFAGLALALAGMGIYSVIAYGVAQRTNEFGIRFALGAAARDVIALVMKEGLRLSLVGLVVGLGLSFAVTRLMQRLLFEVSPRDPWLYTAVALFICAVAALASFVPAMRATRIDPMQALRTE